MKKIILAALILLAGVFILRFVIGGNEDNWICNKGEWVKHGNPSIPIPNKLCED